MSKFTRREFLKGAALGAAGIATLGVTSLGNAEEASQADLAKAEFEAAAAPIEPAAPPASWDYEADVIIVGSGGGGFTSALCLAEAGLSVIIVEKLGLTGGTSRCSGFFVNFGGHRQANEAEWAWPSYPYDVDTIVEYLNNDFMHLSGDPELLRAMVIAGPACIDWMIDDLGIDLVPSTGAPSGNRALYENGQVTKYNSININNHCFDYLTELAEQQGIHIHRSTTVTALVMDNDTCTGVQAVDIDDNEVYYHGVKAVFLMAGGFEMNRAMLKKYVPYIANGIANCACPAYNYGEVIRMGIGAGADMFGYNSVATYDGGVWWKEYEEYEPNMESHINKDGNQAVRQPWLRINQMGQRVPYFSSTGSAYPYAISDNTVCTGLTDGGAVESTQPGGGLWVCFDSKYEDLVNENYFAQTVCRVGKIIPEDDALISRVPLFQRDWRIGFQMMVDAGVIKQCDTIEELEAAMDMPEGMLVEHVNQWNAACEAGEDYVANYKYDPSWLIPINEPPYYSAKIGGHIFTTKCGLRINHSMQVIDTKGAAISGLYAGWHTAGGAVGENNISGRPFNGMYGDVGQSFVGGYMAANALIEKLG